jgi:protein SCO1
VRPRDVGLLAAAAGILIVTAAWWALALWPAGPSAPEWWVRTRDVCFGTTASGLPNGGGWILLIGQPIGMIGILVAVWPRELRAALARFGSNALGQVTLGLVAAAVSVGLIGVTVRVARADGDVFRAAPDRDVAAELVRLSDAAPATSLLDQHGQIVTLDALRGRPVLVTFAYAHCETVCPLVVDEVLSAQRRVAELRPVVLVVTIDPWRDTPGRLPSIADAWRMGADAHVLSGSPGDVDRLLNAWRVPRVRNERTGDLTHPSMVYVIDPEGRITYAVGAHADEIVAAVRAL